MSARWVGALFAVAALAPHSSAQSPRLDLKPGPVPVDAFHPDRATAAKPVRGGSVNVHVPSLPASLNAMIEGSGVARQILYELHDSLVQRDWETWEYVPSLAERFEVEDTLILTDGRRVVGDVEQLEDETWRVSHGGKAEFETFDDEGATLLRSSAFTFHLRSDVRWHDGHAFGARDVLFTFACFKNPAVRCDRKRYLYDKFERVEQLDERTVRFHLAREFEGYFLALSAFDESFTILPAHLYDLSDPDNVARREGASAEERAKAVNEGAHNRQWIGLGPFRLVEWSADRITAERFDGYRGPAPYLDRLVWRAIADNQAATTALLEGELDYFDRLSVEDYFGARTQGPQFEERFYKAFHFTPTLSLTAWNTSRPTLADARVRTALGLCFDWDAFVASFYRGLAVRVTGEQTPVGPSYDRTLAPLPHDLKRARELLAEAGWIDRDGDGRLDREGQALSLGYVFPAGNEVSSTTGELWQAELAKIGVTLELQPRESAALADILRKREFDGAALGLALPFESDPEQLWHSKWADSPSANRSGLKDTQVDSLIERIQRELDPERRNHLFHALQRRIYELQPATFGVWAPRRFALDRRIRGVQLFALDPGVSLRRWYRTD